MPFLISPLQNLHDGKEGEHAQRDTVGQRAANPRCKALAGSFRPGQSEQMAREPIIIGPESSHSGARN